MLCREYITISLLTDVMYLTVRHDSRIFATLPVTTATGERSFSALKYIINYLRSTMGEERLNGIAHTSINSDTALEYSSD